MFDSVRARLTAWYTMVLAAVLIFLSFLTYFIYQRNLSQRTDADLAELADSFATTFATELPAGDAPAAIENAAHESMIEHRFRDTVYAIVDSSGTVLTSSLELPSGTRSRERAGTELFGTPAFRELAIEPQDARQGMRTVPGGKSGFRGFARELPVAGRQIRLVALKSLHAQDEMMEDIRNTFLLAIPIALLLAGASGYFLARKSLAPVAAMASQAQAIGASNLQDRLKVANQRDEFGQLALAFNQLLHRLEQSFERQQRFIADASHELRTPVAILRGEAEVTLGRENRSPEEYRESLGILRDESERLARIVEDLFTLTRADAGEYHLNLGELYLDELAADVLRRARSLAISKDVALKASITPELPLRADESLLRRMLLNLIENAVKYTPPGGQISIGCHRVANEYLFTVTDTGEGIPTEHRDRIFERFFRVDKARCRSEGEAGGAGLGLSIATWIAQAHHGRIELTRSDSAGSTFTVFLPTTSSS